MRGINSTWFIYLFPLPPLVIVSGFLKPNFLAVSQNWVWSWILPFGQRVHLGVRSAYTDLEDKGCEYYFCIGSPESCLIETQYCCLEWLHTSSQGNPYPPASGPHLHFNIKVSPMSAALLFLILSLSPLEDWRGQMELGFPSVYLPLFWQPPPSPPFFWEPHFLPSQRAWISKQCNLEPRKVTQFISAPSFSSC